MNTMRRARHVLCLVALLGPTGCMITLGPRRAELDRSPNPPVLRLGEIKETLTGSWVTQGGAGSPVITGKLARLFSQSGAASLFSSEPGNLALNIEIVVDHEADDPKLVKLAFVSIATLGLVPLNGNAEWHARCQVQVAAEDGVAIAKYPIHVTGSYSIWAFPPTMIAFMGAAGRAWADARAIFERMANNVAAEIMKAVAADYPRLAEAKRARAGVAEQQPLSIRAGGTTLWVTYSVAQSGAAGQEYVLELHRSRPPRGAAPLRKLAVGSRAGVAGPETPWQWRDPTSVVFQAEGRLWHLEWKVEGPLHKLAAVEARERKLTARELLRHDSFPDLPPGDQNSLLLAWKTRDLLTLLREASTSDLEDHIVGIEEMVLRANEMAEREKDEAQKLIAAGKPGSEIHAEAARAYRACIEILKPILAAIKAEVANRAK
ncbi:MAG TPA: hypothetical protein VNE39_15380 [Planctomycetota bacterium]|nr:hypothetical protein [Planctomycetota bacterium]